MQSPARRTTPGADSLRISFLALSSLLASTASARSPLHTTWVVPVRHRNLYVWGEDRGFCCDTEMLSIGNF